MSRQWTKAIYINVAAVLLQLGSNNALIDGRMGTQQWPTIFVIRCPIYLGDWRTFLPGLLYIPCPELLMLGCGQILLRVVTFSVVTPRAVSIYYALSTIYHRKLRLPIIDASPCPRPPPGGVGVCSDDSGPTWQTDDWSLLNLETESTLSTRIWRIKKRMKYSEC